MVDYREISQEYAQGSIKAAILLNGAADIAVLSKVAALVPLGAAGSAIWAMINGRRKLAQGLLLAADLSVNTEMGRPRFP